ncbi:hypothetical protein J5N97_026764 [Dioscorea zingiberensis]|uniref:Uncharacterized protein n=1 Tax=Dioscorea zingiberensis TaxID=325984 RepID=A0A9D5H6Z0_9LILI|nr:hypothetical protein J5N97_026764 [Dioscorea zingiberensis]
MNKGLCLDASSIEIAAMSTKLQSQCPLNLFNTLLKNNSDVSTQGFRTAFNQLQDSMDRSLEQHNSKESMKNMILKHEELFKHQVCELHRLYRVQKMLMRELLNKQGIDTRTRHWSNTKAGSSSHEFDLEGEEDSLTDEESELELTLSIGCAAGKKKSKLITGPFCFQ